MSSVLLCMQMATGINFKPPSVAKLVSWIGSMFIIRVSWIFNGAARLLHH